MFNDCCQYNNDVTRPTGLVNAPAVRVNFLPLKVSDQSKTIRYVIGYWSFRVFFDHGIIQRSCSHGFCAFSRERKPRLRFLKRKFISIANRGDLFPVICANEDVESQKQIIRRTLAIEIFVRWEGNRRSCNEKRLERPASLIFVRSRTNFSVRSIYSSYRTNCYLESIRRYDVFLFMRSRGDVSFPAPLCKC